MLALATVAQEVVQLLGGPSSYHLENLETKDLDSFNNPYKYNYNHSYDANRK